MDVNKKRIMWGISAVVWPIVMIMTYLIAPPHIHGSGWAVLAMTVLMMVMGLSSFKVKESNIVVLEGVSIAVFLIFGLFVELMVMQIAMFTHMLPRRLGKDQWYRYAFNLTMFALMSVAGGGTFYALGGVTGTTPTQTLHVIPILGYIIVVFLLNQLLIFTFSRYLFGTGDLFGRDTLWEAVTKCLITPVGIILYLLYSQMGTSAIYIIAVPMVTLSVIFRLVNNSYEMNRLLQKTNEVGSQLTEKLDSNNIIQLFFEKIGTIMNVDYAFILEADDKNSLYYTINHYYKKDMAASDHRAMGSVIRWPRELDGKNYLAHSRREWRRLLKGFLPVTAQSVLIVPKRDEHHAIGAVVIATQERRAYGKHHLMLLEIISNFLTVAIDNAYNYEKTKKASERDPLTNLYNYRYFSNLLEKLYTDENGEPFSIIMIDLDHFKQINDTYGHESGNFILKGVAERLISIIGDKGTVARYGGEEFIILLPQIGNSVCYELAEEIRQRLSSEPFLLTMTTHHTDNRRLVHVTASMGIATAPSQGEDSLSLIRNADRAMYAGAKRRGRNRVATYIG